MIEGETGMYNGFLIVERDEEPVKAYRSQIYLTDGISSYEASGWLSLKDAIDKAGDWGEFTDDQYRELTGKEPGFVPPEDIVKLVKVLPFLPEPGPPLPEYVYKEVRPSIVTNILDPSSSTYGGVLADDVARDMSEFLEGGNFVIVERLNESGWSSDSIGWDAKIKHVPTNTDWDIEVWVIFEWRQPERIETSFVDFNPTGAQTAEDKWEIMPEEEWAKSSFDITAAGGAEASRIISEYVSRGRQDGRKNGAI